jgi:hypothetical protein
MSEGVKVFLVELGKRTLQVAVLVVVEEVIRRGLITAFTDNDFVQNAKEQIKNKKRVAG